MSTGERRHAEVDVGDEARAAPEMAMVDLVEEECLRLLGTRDVGRLAVVVHGSPEVFPVNYVLDGHTVVFRSGRGTKVDAASLGMVAFEVDDIDPRTHQGWVVEVRGLGREITDGIDAFSERIRALELAPWVGGSKDRWITIVAPAFSGRRLTPVDGALAPH
jgi:hypothetical protein